MDNRHSIAGNIAFALGKGLVAGLAGTVAITVSQMIEMKISKRESSDTPAKAVNKVLHVKATDEEHKEEFIQQVHFTYGTAWGVCRGLLDLAGVKGLPATATHYAAVWGTEMALLPSLKIAPPVTKWGGGEIAKDGFHHLVYATVAGLVYDAID